ncbi:MAG: cell wall hydrolase [Sphingomonadales bacterium]|nr:cell wall hydrolase [Sphingomonadales bacterium]NCO48194.1 cell wall hydrolase [Sphingomonadales bacterium]NCO99777.1 cell wall hydrolase [Sphingomonadales bacterium]NCP28171.1 cell wall hydrolase [Sphingomonadales bacterium]NCP42403.1 cell wall hydrolase [Sphingomonadales bacterium]
MSKIFRATSVLSLALTAVAALSFTDASFALEASDETPEAEIFVDPALLADDESNPAIIFGEQQEVVAQIPQDVVDSDRLANGEAEFGSDENSGFIDDGASSLRQLVRQQSVDGSLDAEMQCLAGTVYFESKGESLQGQLAVARVVLARVASSRFPNSICGVVFQRSQFSFVRGGKMPPIRTGQRHWRNAVAIAKIAMNDGWESPVEGALFFHARYVSPGWRLTRLATIDNHIFYR